MKKIGVDLSPHQRRRLHNGHPVRVKKGEGIMLVNPSNFDTMSRTFLRGKAKEIRLTPEEVRANYLLSPEAHNYNRGETLQAPSVAPQVAPLNSAPANITGGRISNAGGSRGGYRVSSMAGLKQVNDHLQKLEELTGKDLGDQLKSGLGNLMANMATIDMNKAGLLARKGNMKGGELTASNFYGDMARKAGTDIRQGIFGRGKRENFYGDNQIGLGYGIGRSQVGVGGNLMDHRMLIPALQSQPFSANWGFGNQLPPQYQKFSRGV
jgi:hypothetical protein